MTEQCNGVLLRNYDPNDYGEDLSLRCDRRFVCGRYDQSASRALWDGVVNVMTGAQCEDFVRSTEGL